MKTQPASKRGKGVAELSQHILTGSKAERVVQHAPCPVLVVREREHEFLPIDPGPGPEESLT